MARFDYAVFSEGKLVTNALLTEEEAERMELDGFRCVRVRDTVGDGLPAFRGRRYETGRPPFRRKWGRD